MKLYKCFIFLICLTFISTYFNITATENSAQPSFFTVENKILNKKIYAALYEQFGPSRWRRIIAPTPIDILKAHTFTLTKEKNQYAYAIATEAVILSKEIISQQEKNALQAQPITTSKLTINSLFFSSKNPLNLEVITIHNDYKHPLFIARYVPHTTKKLLNFDLATVIFQCNPNTSISIALPTNTDIVLLAAQKSDSLKETVDLKETSNKNLFIARGLLKDWEKNITKNSYELSQLFAPDALTIVNDTRRDWTVSLYAAYGSQQLQKITDAMPCKANKEIVYNKKLFFPIAHHDYKSSLWVLFEHDTKKIEPALSINHTLHGGTVARSTTSARLSRWFSESKKNDNTAKPDNTKKEDAPLAHTTETTFTDTNALLQKNEEPITQDSANIQNTITGTFDMQVSNVTSKDIFVALYKKDKKNYTRREKPIKVTKKQPVSIGYEENEILVYSVSKCELTDSLTTREHNALNSQTDLKEFNEKELKIKETMFIKDSSFNMIEISIENNRYNDIVVGRYEQKRPGRLTLAGVVQRIPKKDMPLATNTTNNTADTESADADTQKTINATIASAPNFAVPYNYKSFVGYQDSYSEESTDVMDNTIDTVFSFERNHLTKIDTSEKQSFDADKEFKGDCIVVENDFSERKWSALYTLDDKKLSSAESMSAQSKKRLIPYYDTMKLIVKDNYFDTSRDIEGVYTQLFIDTHTSYNYYLKDATVVASSVEKKKEKARVEKQRMREKEKQEEQRRLNPTKPRIEKPVKPKAEEKLQEKPSEFFVEVQEEQERKPSKKKPTPVMMRDSECADNQIRVNNHSGKDVSMRFYYKGFFNTIMVEKSNIYGIPNGQALCFDRPISTYLSDRYVVIALNSFDLKESYSSKEIAQLVKDGRAFNIENKKEINLIK